MTTPCAETDPEVFYDDFDLARKICSECPAATPCLERALHLERNQPRQMIFGVVGGATPEERWQEMLRRNGEVETCSAGHLRTPGNTKYKGRGDGKRKCLDCEAGVPGDAGMANLPHRYTYDEVVVARWLEGRPPERRRETDRREVVTRALSEGRSPTWIENVCGVREVYSRRLQGELGLAS